MRPHHLLFCYRWTNTVLEEELHEKAHIDYDRVAIVCFVPYKLLFGVKNH